MFYREKILLNLLNVFGGKLDKISLFKLLFLFSTLPESANRYYEFVPYKYGAYSFTARSDINRMERDGIISESPKSFILQKFDKQLYKINDGDFEKIEAVYRRFHNKKADDLMKITYELYPYYAKDSEKRELVTKEIKNKIKETISRNNETTLFGIGYEGKSLEAYLNILIKNNIKNLIDVRKNPFSRKYSFSKNTLSKRVNDFGIKYIHMPELGIEPHKRQNLNSLKDYRKLFDDYEKTTLKQNVKSLERIYNILTKNKKAALTCFEADKEYCHRYRIVSFMYNIYPGKFAIKHL